MAARSHVACVMPGMAFSKYVPAAQLLQTVAPASVDILPPTQLTHAVAPAAAAKVPLGHLLQAAAVVIGPAIIVPARQDTHELAAAL